MKMTKLKQLIGETKAIFASVLCLPTKALAAAGLLALVLLAPCAQAAEVTCDRAVLNSGDTTNLVEGFTYTPPVQQVENGGAFYLNAGATLRGTNVTFKGHGVHAKPTANHGGAIYSTYGVISISGGYFLDNVSLAAGGGIVNSGGKLNISSVTFSNNEASKGGAICNDKKGSVAITNANFYGNHANNTSGGAICNSSGTLDIFGCNFMNGTGESGGAIDNRDVMNISGATFEGNKAPKGGAIANSNKGTVNFNGVVTLVTTNDTIYNKGTLNWNLADGKAGRLNGYDKTSNNGTDAKLQLTVEDYATTTNFTLATGNFSDTAGKDAFSITNVAGGAALTGLTIDGAAVTSADKLTGYKLVTEEDLSVPTTNLVLKVIKYTCTRKVLNAGDSTNLVAGTTYTAAPSTDKEGGVFNVKNGATLTGTDVVFADNEAYAGGAIYNDGGTVALKNADFKRNKAQTLCGAICNNSGTLSLGGVTFEGNKARDGGGAIGSMGTVHFDGAVTLKTETDTIYNLGTLNWNLADGKQGFLDGYDKLDNSGGTLQLTVEDYQAATNIVIATGDFTDVKGKDTFLMTNVTGGVSATIKIGGVALLNGTWWSLAVEDADKLVLKTAETVTLSDVMTGVATNASGAVVKVGGTEIAQNPDGGYTVPKGCAITVVYTAKDDYMFAAGMKTKTVTVGPLAENYAMTDDDKPTAEERWADVREIAIDTRARIVVAAPEEVLPLAYSTNGWGWADAPGAHDPAYDVTLKVDDKLLLSTNLNGYAEWMPEVGAYGKYDIWQEWLTQGMTKGSTNVTVYYSTYYPLTWSNEGGTLSVTNAGKAIASGDTVLGYDLVTFAAKPDEGSVLSRKGFQLLTNGVEIAGAVTGDAMSGYRFYMPNDAAEIKSAYVKATGVTVNGEDIALGSGTGWTYDNGALKLTASQKTRTDFTLSGVASGLKVSAIASGPATLVLENFTNDVTGVEGASALNLSAKSWTVVQAGTNYLAAGDGRTAIAVAWGEATFSGTGTLVAVSGKDANGALLPGIGNAMSTVAITNGTYTGTIDPALVPWSQTGRSYNTAAVANNDVLGTWTVKDVGMIRYKSDTFTTYLEVTNDVDALLEPPPPPTMAGKAFTGWWSYRLKRYFDFSTDTMKNLQVGKDHGESLYAQFEDAATSPSSTVVPKGGDTPVVVDTFEKAAYFAPDGGEITVCNTDLVATVEKPLIIRKGEGATLDITAGEGLDKKVGGDGTVYVGEKTNGVVVVAQDAGTDDPKKAGVATERAFAIVDRSILDEATKTPEAQAADALVASIAYDVDVKQTGTDVGALILDVTPVLTLTTLKDGAVTSEVAYTNDFPLSGEAVLVTVPCGAMKPVAVIHSHEGVATVLRPTTDPNPAEGYFVYDAVANTVRFRMSEFSEVTLLGEEKVVTIANMEISESYAGRAIETTNITVMANLSLTATEYILLNETNGLMAALTLNAPEGGITNRGTIVWYLMTSEVKKSWLNSYDAIVQTASVTNEIETTWDLANGEYVLADDARSAVGQTFRVSATSGKPQSKDLVVGGETFYNGAKAFSLKVNDEGQLVYKVGLSKPQTLYIASDPDNLGTVTWTTNGIPGTWSILPGTEVKVVAIPAEHCEFVNWTGHDEDGNDVVFKDPLAKETTFTMPETNTSITAHFQVSAAYRADAEKAIVDTALAASNTVEKLNLPRSEKDAYIARIVADRDRQVKAVKDAVTPAQVDAAVTAAKTSIAKTVNEAVQRATVVSMIRWTVAPTNFAGTVSVTNRAHATALVPVTAEAATNWVFASWSAFTNGVELVATNVFTNVTTSVSAFTMPATNVLVEATFAVDPAYKAEIAAAITNAAAQAIGAITNMNLSAQEKLNAVTEVEGARFAAILSVYSAKTPADVAKAGVASGIYMRKIVEAAQALADREWSIVAYVAPEDAGAAVASTNSSQARKTVTVTATPATNWQFMVWYGLDAASNAVVFADATNLVTTFEMPETNVSVCAFFAVDDAYIAKGKDAIVAAAALATDAITNFNLTAEEKAAYVLAVVTNMTESLKALSDAKTPDDVDAIVAAAVAAFAAIVDDAEAHAAGAYGILSLPVPTDAGWVSVTNAALARSTVTVEAALTNGNYVFVRWDGEDASGEPVGFADATSLVTTFTMPMTNVCVTAVFEVTAAYKATGVTEITNAAAATIADICELRLTDEQKAGFSARIVEGATNALAYLETAHTVKEVDFAVSAAGQVNVTVLRAAIEAQEPEKACVSFATNAVTVTEGEVAYVVVNGGSRTKPTQVTVSLQKNTLTGYTPYYGLDAKGNAKRCSFPLVLNWDAGDTEAKVIGISTKAVSKKEADKFLTLQLGSEANFEGVGTDVCTLTARDAMLDPPEAAPYVRALAWPANGGKVSGYGTLALDDEGGYKSARTLTATANRFATFAGWYKAMADDATKIDLGACVTTEKKLKVGKGTAFGEGTYFAYFTDVTPVAAVDLPDATAPGATGVSCEDGVYTGEVGIRFALPVSFTDETEKGSLSISGLPSGLSYNKKTGRIEGVPTREQEKAVKFVAKNAAGKHTVTFAFEIDPMPEFAAGNFAGTVSDDVDDAGHRTGCGAVTFTAGKTGSLSAKVTTRLSGARSFSTKGYTRLDADTLLIAMTNSSLEVFEAQLSLKNGRYDTFVMGRAVGLDATKRGSLAYNEEGGTVVALRNAFLKADKNEEALAVLDEYKGTYEATLFDTATNAVGSVSYKVSDNGNVTVKVVIDATTEGGVSVPKKTISGTVSGGFVWNPESKRAGIGAALRSGTAIWSCEALFDNKEETAAGAARYIRPSAVDAKAVLDEDQALMK